MAGWFLIGGADAFRQVGTFRGATGWELESTVGVVVWALTGEHRFEAGANRTGHGARPARDRPCSPRRS